jgi:hypothetical protein
MYVIKDGDTPNDVPVMQPTRQPAHISWCDGCGCFRNNHARDFLLVQQNGKQVQLCSTCSTSGKENSPCFSSHT